MFNYRLPIILFLLMATASALSSKLTDWHLQKIEGRHWLIDPGGHRFYILGVNHFSNLNDEQRKQAIKNLKAWNFNVGGYSSPDWLLEELPGIVNLSLHEASHWLSAENFEYTDVFTDSYAERIYNEVKETCEKYRGHPNVIGYSQTDTPRYHLDTTRFRRGIDWVSYIRELPTSTPGKQRYIEFLKERYNNDIEALKVAYRLPTIKSFKHLAKFDFIGLELTREAIIEDDEWFIAIIVDRIYSLTRAAFDKYDPGSLLMTENFKKHDHTDGILKVAAKYCDIISFQAGPTHGPGVGNGPDESEFDPDFWRHIHEVTGRPILINDHACSFHTPEFPRTLWHQFESQEEYAAHYGHYINQVIQVPYIIGYQRCQYMSRYDPYRTLLKQGLLDIDGSPYPIVVGAMEDVNATVLEELGHMHPLD